MRTCIEHNAPANSWTAKAPTHKDRKPSSNNETTMLFNKLLDRLNEETQKSPQQDPELHAFDNLVNANRALLEAYQLYQGHLRDLKLFY